MASSSTAQSSSEAFRSLYIHTHDVSRSLKPSADGELAHAIHQTLHFALDGHPDDYTPPSTNSGAGLGCDPLATMPTSTSTTSSANGTSATASSSSPSSSSNAAAPGNVKKGFFPNPDPERPYISYHWDPRSSTLALPNPATITNPIADPCSPDHRSSYDITAKFFFLDPNDITSDLVDDALTRLTSTTGIITVDTLVLAFPTLDLDSRPYKHFSSQSAADASTNGNGTSPPSWVSRMKDVWSHVSQNPQLFSLGISDISPSNLDLLLTSFSPPIQPPSMPLFSPAIPLSTTSTEPSASTSHPAADSDVPPSTISHPSNFNVLGSMWNLEYSLTSTARRPRIVSINVKQDPCAFDREFDQYCTKMGIQLVAHSDRKDVLPQRTLPGLMNEFQAKLPVKLEDGRKLKPKWALKYTTLIRDRGVLADKGYIVYVETE